jgi:hypothetical protein
MQVTKQANITLIIKNIIFNIYKTNPGLTPFRYDPGA